MKNRIYLQVKIDEEGKRRLKLIAEKNERDMSKQVRHLIDREYLRIFQPDQSQTETAIAERG